MFVVAPQVDALRADLERATATLRQRQLAAQDAERAATAVSADGIKR